MNPQLFAQMNKQFGGMFDDMDPSQMKQAENVWKMLDDMAQSDPDQYQKFVSSNIEQGFDEMKKEKKEKVEQQMVIPEKGFLIKTQANLKFEPFKLKDGNSEMQEKFVISNDEALNEEATKKYQIFKSKCDKEVKFYINVLKHKRVKGPLGQDMKEVKDFDNPQKWKIVPVSVSQVASRKSESYGTEVYFVDAVINDQVFEFMQSQVQLQVSLVQFVTDRVQDEVKFQYNPLMNHYSPAQVKEVLYYQFEKVSLKKHTKKLYKGVDKKNPNEIKKLLISIKYDKDGEKFQEQQKNKGKQEDLVEEQKKKYEEAKKFGNFAPSTPEDLLNQAKSQQTQDKSGLSTSFGNSNSNNNSEKVLDGLRLIDKSEKKETTKKPFKIEEVSSTTTPNNEQKQQQQQSQDIGSEKKQQQQQKQQQQPTVVQELSIEEKVKLKLQKEAEELQKAQQKLLENIVEQPKFTLNDNSSYYIKIEIQLPKVKSFKQINLDISSTQLLLTVPDTYNLDIKFSAKINNDELEAKWEKKNKCLKLTLPKI